MGPFLLLCVLLAAVLVLMHLAFRRDRDRKRGAVELVPLPAVDLIPVAKGAHAPRVIESQVAGVTFANPDGSSRQKLIARHCRDGQALVAVREPRNARDPNAIALWLPVKAKGKVQIGYIKGQLAARLAPFMDKGGRLEVEVLEVTGGEDGLHRGVDIEIRTVGRG